MNIIALSITIAIIAAAFIPQTTAFSGGAPRRTVTSSTSLDQSPDDATQPANSSSRRAFLAKVASSSVALTVVQLPQPALAAATSTKDALVSDLRNSLEAISTIPALVEQAEWDKVRTVLKTPPVNQLWNLGESQNTLVKLAKETGEFDLVEMKDELAISLQMTDQYSYDNNFIYYQPGEFFSF